MGNERPYCLSIAGFDPSAGAGVLADVKTFEQLEVYGLGVVSALTYQNEDNVEGLEWMQFYDIEKQLLPILKYPIKAIKIGLIKDLALLEELLNFVKSVYKDAFIIWDPVLKASAGFNFHKKVELSETFLSKLNLITPNYDEYQQLGFDIFKRNCAVLLKGGHKEEERGTDILFLNGTEYKIYGEEFKNKHDKHGTGCVFSSAVAAYISKRYNIIEACKQAKKYVEMFILSNNGKLGYHKI